MHHFRLFGNTRPRIDTQQHKRPRNQQLQMTSVLQQCKQIMRQDKIFIRSKIKQNDAETLAIFRRHRKQTDLKQLQIALRKYISAIKTQFKMEQLNRFKENLCELYGEVSGGKPKSKPKAEGNVSRGKPLRTMESTINENYQQRRSINSAEKKRQTRSTSGSKRPAWTSNLYSTLRPPVIEQTPAETEVTCRSKSQTSAPVNPPFNSSTTKKSTPHHPNPYRHHQHQTAQVSAQRQRQRQRPSLRNLKSQRDTNSFWNDAFQKYVGTRNIVEQQCMRKVEEDSIQEKLENFSVNISETQLDNGEVNIRLPTFEGDTTEQNQGRENQGGLFTSPQLIEECRHLLSLSNKFDSFTKTQQPKKRPQPPQPSSSTTTNKPIPINLDSQLQTLPTNPPTFQQPAQQLFHLFFPDHKTTKHTRTTFKQLTAKHFPCCPKYLQLFNLTDKDNDNIITSVEFGNTLLTICKPKPNTVRDIFSLIDIDRNGVFTERDLERFLGQVLEGDAGGDAAEEAKEIVEVTRRIFMAADVSGNRRISYWGLYQTRAMPEFTQFSEFLEQFEFQIQA